MRIVSVDPPTRPAVFPEYRRTVAGRSNGNHHQTSISDSGGTDAVDRQIAANAWSPLPGATITTGNPIAFISDLHFDYTRGKYCPENASLMRQQFIAFVKTHFAGELLCLAGDIYDDYEDTLSFVKELEANQIDGFFVLGNHDYWNGGRLTYTEIVDLFMAETADHTHFRFLSTGRQYRWNDLCVIGDTGWTSFRRGDGPRRVPLKEFTLLKDAQRVAQFDPKQVIALHDEWIDYANRILRTEEKVLVVTHFPMFDLTTKDEDCWWSSVTGLSGNNSWRIFGHTHISRLWHNNTSRQRGYNNATVDELRKRACQKEYSDTEGRARRTSELTSDQRDVFVEKRWDTTQPANQYSLDDFGRLVTWTGGTDVVLSGTVADLAPYYTFDLVESPGPDPAAIAKIKRNGFVRVRSNLRNLTALAKSRHAYLEQVESELELLRDDQFIGYYHPGRVRGEDFAEVRRAIAILKKETVGDVRAFMTAAVVTGYLYNKAVDWLKEMRPLDDYDVLRLWLFLKTIRRFEIPFENVERIQRHPRKFVQFANVPIHLPTVDGQSLDVQEVELLMRDAGLLGGPAVGLDGSSRTLTSQAVGELHRPES